MRNRKAFFSAAITVAVLIAGAVVTAGGPQGTSVSAAAISVPGPPPPPPTSCNVGDFQFSVSSGPSFVNCPVPILGDQCTQIVYHVSGSPEVVLALEGEGVVFVSSSSPTSPATIADPCDGINNFGRGSCHEQAVETSPDDSGDFSITLAGLREPAATSVAIDPDHACRILGIGLEAGPNTNQTTQRTETINFKGCMVEFTRDAATGEVVRARLLPNKDLQCTGPSLTEGGIINPRPVGELQLTLPDGTSLGNGTFGDGYISSGNSSCTTRVIGGRVYTWGTAPCP